MDFLDTLYEKLEDIIRDLRELDGAGERATMLLIADALETAEELQEFVAEFARK